MPKMVKNFLFIKLPKVKAITIFLYLNLISAGLIRKGTAYELLEAQAACGKIVDVQTGRVLSVETASKESVSNSNSDKMLELQYINISNGIKCLVLLTKRRMTLRIRNMESAISENMTFCSV